MTFIFSTIPYFLMSSYCQFVKTLPQNHPHVLYHNSEYGFPLQSDDALFGRLLLEINQAGLSWLTILNKKENFRTAYANFSVKAVANFNDHDFKVLLNNPSIIRNKLKINAAVHNAQIILALQKEYGSFKAWLNAHHPLQKEAWIKLFKKHFKFTGGEITNEFLMSTGYLKGAHSADCEIHAKILKQNPAWLRNS